MEIQELNNILRHEATQKGMCGKVARTWVEDWDKDELLRQYVLNIEFCIEQNFPDNGFILSNFDTLTLHDHNVFIRETIKEENLKGAVVINDCGGEIVMSDFSVANIYLRGNSNITIRASRFSKVFVTLLDNATLNIEQEDYSQCYVYQYGEHTECKTKGNIKIRKKVEHN
jgi:hypothetical protein